MRAFRRTTSLFPFSLYGDGSRSTAEPADEPGDGYTSERARPVAFVTEPTVAPIGGPDDYRPVERRDGVPVYSTEPPAEHTEVTGPVRVHLLAAQRRPTRDVKQRTIATGLPDRRI
jgi:predicted acyl esterase